MSSGISEAGEEIGWSNQRPQKPDEEICSYLKSVSGSLESNLDDDSKDVLIKNVFEEIIGLEASLACNRRTAVVLEDLIRLGGLKELVTFFTNIKKYFGFLCTNRQASFVLQRLLDSSFVQFQKSDNNDDISKMADLFTDLTKTLVVKEIWWDLMFDPCGTHVIRGIICLLANKPPSKKIKVQAENTVVSKESKQRKATFVASLIAFLVDMSKWEKKDIKMACMSTHASPVVQLLLQHCPNKHKAWKSLLVKILSQEGNDDYDAAVLISLANDKIGSHIVETIVANCDDQLFNDIVFEKFLKGRMQELALNRVANYVLQNGLSNIKTQEQCEIAYAELGDGISTNLLDNKLGVVWKVCEAGLKGSKSIQSKISRAVLRGARELYRDKSPGKGTVELLLSIENASDERLVNDNDQPTDKEFSSVKVAILGARIVCVLVQFNPESSRAILESIASMSVDTLRLLCNDPVGGKYVMESVMDAPPSASWAKQRILLKLKDELPLIAENRFGWHFLRKAFDNGAIKDRTLIVKALARKERRMLGSTYGALLHKHCKVTLYKQNPEQWLNEQEHLGHKQKLKKMETFIDDLEDIQTATKKRKDSKPPKKKKRKLI